MKLGYLSLYTKIDSKWIKDLYRRPKTNYIEENIGTKLRGLGLKRGFYESDPKDKGSKSKSK